MPTAAQRYATIKPYVKNAKPYFSEEDGLRTTAYDAYYDFYWNNQDSFTVVQRGDNERPIYLPTARIIVNTLARYICPDFKAVADAAYGTTNEQEELKTAFDNLFAREGFHSKFISNKLAGIIRGDALWYITADPDKEEGTRISIQVLDPGLVTKIEDESDPDRFWGYDIIEDIVVRDTVGVKRTRWLKPGHEDNPSEEFVSYSVEAFELEGFGSDEQKNLAGVPFDIETGVVLEGITHLPIYHVTNLPEDGFHWGSSEIRGLESMIAGVNQTISDEDITLALQGLGFYMTDGGPPVDAAGNETDWEIGPGQVVEVGQGRKFERVSGVGSVEPMQKHIDLIEDHAYRVNGTGDVSQGIVSVEAAESGIALHMRLAPLLETAGQKELWITTILNQMFYDLREWLQVYEGLSFGEARMVCSVGSAIPVNKKQRFDELLTLYTAEPPIISGKTFRKELELLGYNIPDDDLTQAVSEKSAYFSAVQEPDALSDDEEQEQPGAPEVTDEQ